MLLLICSWYKFCSKVKVYLMKINTGTNKNQAQSRKFNIAHQTRKVSTPVFRGSVRKLCAHLFTRVLELFHKRKCLNFHEMLSKKTHLQLEAEEDRNTHSVIGYVQKPIGKQEFQSATWVFMFKFKAQQTELLYRSRHNKVQLKLLLPKQLSTKPTWQLMRYYQGRNYALQSKNSHYLQKNTKLEFSEPQFNSPQ